MNKEDEIAYILQLKKEAEDATFNRRRAADELWMLYQNRQDYSKKKDWQSKIFVPKIFMSIEQATAMVKRAIMSPKKLFKMAVINSEDEKAKDALPKIEERLKLYLKNSNFATSYAETMKEAFLVGLGVPKVLWENGGLKFVNVATSKVYIDPDYEMGSSEPPKFIIEEKEWDLAELKVMAARINKETGRRIFNMAEINKIEESSQDPERDINDQTRRGLNTHAKTDRRVMVLEFWGTIIDESKNKALKNQLRVIVNERVIVRSQDNPFDHQKLPYLPVVPITYPHRGVWGTSLVESVVKMQYAYNNIINLGIDNLNFSVNKVYTAQASQIVNPRSLTNIYPGKIVHVHGGEPFKEVRTSGLGQDSFMVLQQLQGEIERGTAITEFLMGTSGKSKTAKEAELKTAQAQGLFDTIARDIEVNSMAPLIEMAFDLVMQYGDIPPEFRGRYRFDVGGLSLLLIRREQTEQITQVLALALKSQTIASMTNIRELYSKYLNMQNLDDILAEKKQGPNADQQREIEEGSREQAQKMVSQMSDEEIMQS